MSKAKKDTIEAKGFAIQIYTRLPAKQNMVQ
ncbi:Uncharacterised protein [Streptococcus agalactiae]|nr:Uncharacterised protein [Streptococcus agalactiae]